MCWEMGWDGMNWIGKWVGMGWDELGWVGSFPNLVGNWVWMGWDELGWDVMGWVAMG